MALLALMLLGGSYWAFTEYAPQSVVETIGAAIGQVAGGDVLVASVGTDPIHVRDGDTIVVSGQPIRFQGVNCPEIGQRGAGPSRDSLVRTLAAASQVTCRLNGEHTYGRAVGRCSADGQDIGMLLIEAGLCGRCIAYDKIGYYARVHSGYEGPVPGYCRAF